MNIFSLSRSSIAAVTRRSGRPERSRRSMPSGAASTQQDGDVGAAAVGQQPAAVLERAAGGQHRVEDEDRQAGQVTRQRLHVGARLEGLLVAGQADEAHRRLGQQRQRGVGHAEAGPQHRHDQRRVGQPGALGGRHRRLDRVTLDRERARRLVDEHGGQFVQRGTERAGVGPLVTHRGQSRLGQRVIYDEYVHEATTYRYLSRLAGMTTTAPPFAEVTRSAGALRTFLHGLPGVDQVGAEARAAMLGTRSIKTTAKAWAIDLAIRMVDLTTLEGADTPGQGPRAVRQGAAARPGRPELSRRSPPSASTRRWCRSRRPRSAGSGVHLASVATAFPSGQAPLEVKLADTRAAVDAGADEIDMVINRGAFLAGRYCEVFDEIVAVKEACGGAHLKVILETGELATLRQRPPRLLAGDAGRRRLHQDLDRQGPAGRDPAGHPGHAGGGPRLPGRDRPDQVGVKPAGGIRTARTRSNTWYWSTRPSARTGSTRTGSGSAPRRCSTTC